VAAKAAFRARKIRERRKTAGFMRVPIQRVQGKKRKISFQGKEKTRR
jgi:hypothetical protein